MVPSATNMKRPRWIAVLLSIGLLTGLAVGTALADRQSPPPRPDWIGPDGKADMSKLPDRMPVLDRTGKVVGEIELSRLPNSAPDAGEMGAEDTPVGPPNRFEDAVTEAPPVEPPG